MGFLNLKVFNITKACLEHLDTKTKQINCIPENLANFIVIVYNNYKIFEGFVLEMPKLMKKSLIRIFLLLSLISLLGGCINQPVETLIPSDPVIQTSAVSNIPTNTATPPCSVSPEFILPSGAIIPAEDEATDAREMFKNMRTESGEWIYYADWSRMFYFQDDYECPLKRVKKDGSGDMDLNVTGFSFIVVDPYIYVDKNHTFGDFGHWDTVRIDLDGANQKDMPYSNMSIKIYGDRIYFDTWDGSVLYAADSACEQVKEYIIDVPDQQTIKDKLKNISPVYFLSIYDVKDGWIYFHYSLLDTDGMSFYKGDYKVNVEGTIVEKTNEGTFNETQIGYYN